MICVKHNWRAYAGNLVFSRPKSKNTPVYALTETETEMEQNKKCPKCDKGTMKAVSNSVPVFADVPREKEMQSACDQCGYQDDFIKFYPIFES